jgi:hypothetical protein
MNCLMAPLAQGHKISVFVVGSVPINVVDVELCVAGVVATNTANKIVSFKDAAPNVRPIDNGFDRLFGAFLFAPLLHCNVRRQCCFFDLGAMIGFCSVLTDSP